MTYKAKYLQVVYFLARYGTFSIGVVYLMIGVTAILSLLGLKEGGADEDSVLEHLVNFIPGKLFIILITGGMVSYIIWRLHEAIADPYLFGRDFSGLVTRIGIGCSASAYAVIAYSGIQALFELHIEGNGAEEQQVLIREIFEWHWGEWVVGLAGITIGVSGVMEMKYILNNDHEPRLEVERLSHFQKLTIEVIAWIGHIARAIILVIVSYYLIKAAVKSDPEQVADTDSAFNVIGEGVFGHPLFVAVAIGTICYGLFMFVFTLFYKFKKG